MKLGHNLLVFLRERFSSSQRRASWCLKPEMFSLSSNISTFRAEWSAICSSSYLRGSNLLWRWTAVHFRNLRISWAGALGPKELSLCHRRENFDFKPMYTFGFGFCTMRLDTSLIISKRRMANIYTSLRPLLSQNLCWFGDSKVEAALMSGIGRENDNRLSDSIPRQIYEAQRPKKSILCFEYSRTKLDSTFRAIYIHVIYNVLRVPHPLSQCLLKTSQPNQPKDYISIVEMLAWVSKACGPGWKRNHLVYTHTRLLASVH